MSISFPAGSSKLLVQDRCVDDVIVTARQNSPRMRLSGKRFCSQTWTMKIKEIASH